jgi:hypothetical protein
MWNYWLILEESTLQTLIETFIIPEYFIELTNKLKIISSGGNRNVPKRIESFFSFFIYGHLSPFLQNSVWVLIDGDKDGEAIRENFINSFCSSDKKWEEHNFILLEKAKLEDYYPEHISKKLNGNNKIELVNEFIIWLNNNNGAKEYLISNFKILWELLNKISNYIKEE